MTRREPGHVYFGTTCVGSVTQFKPRCWGASYALSGWSAHKFKSRARAEQWLLDQYVAASCEKAAAKAASSAIAEMDSEELLENATPMDLARELVRQHRSMTAPEVREVIKEIKDCFCAEFTNAELIDFVNESTLTIEDVFPNEYAEATQAAGIASSVVAEAVRVVYGTAQEREYALRMLRDGLRANNIFNAYQAETATQVLL